MRAMTTATCLRLICLATLLHGSSTADGQQAPAKPAAKMQVILLGTGFPRPSADRAGPSTAVVVGEKVFVVDAGRGVVMRLAATEFPLSAIRAVFLTHLHSDHIDGLPDLFNTPWVLGRAAPFELYGPKGTRKLADGMLKFFAEDIHIRRDLTEMHPAAGARINVHIVREGVVYLDEDVRVTAFAVDHRWAKPAFGYRFDTADRSAVISGDTTLSENLIQYAKGADVLVHEAALPEHFEKHDTPEVAARLKAYHSTPEQAGEAAERAGVKLLVLTHLVPGDKEEEFLARASKTFHGKIVVGRDLMRF